jgi:hypothetical protein
MPTEQKKGFLEEIQSLAPEKKRNVLIVGTLIAMAVLIYVWIGYFKGLVVTAAQAPASPAVAAAATSTPIAIVPVAPSTSSASVGSSIWQDIKSAMGDFANIFSGPSQYNIQPKSN